MIIDIQYIQMPTSKSMTSIIKQKLEKLTKKYNWIISANIFLKSENDSKGNGKICEIQLGVPGLRLFAKSNENNFEKVVVETIHDLEKQLKKRNDFFNRH